MKVKINTPEGTRDRLFAECAERRQVQTALTELFRRRGYSEVMTPVVEYYDLFVQSGNPIPQETMLKIIDRSGKILVMRPDSTAPIARVAASRLKGMVLPQRLYYEQTVFRSGNAHEGGSLEVAQCGVEMIGASGLKSDLETIALAVDALRCCGVSDFHIEVGHADFFRVLAAQMNMTDEETEQMRSCIEGKNYALLNDLLENYRGQSSHDALKRLPYLFGGAEILDEAELLAGPSDSVAYLRQLYCELNAAGYGAFVRFDLGLVHQIDYYTGVVFRGYVEGAGAPVLSGGRYDSLVGKFGCSAAATGFAVDVDAVGSCLPVSVQQLEVMIHYEQGQLARALAKLDGFPAGSCELSPCATLPDTVKLAQKRNATSVIVVDQSGERWLQV